MPRKKKLITKEDMKAMIKDPKSKEKIAKYNSLEDFMRTCDVECQHYIMTYGIYQLIEAIIHPKED